MELLQGAVDRIAEFHSENNLGCHQSTNRSRLIDDADLSGIRFAALGGW